MPIGTGGVKLEDRVLDLGLNVLDTETTHIHVCSAQPTSYSDLLTKTLGNKNWGAGNAFGVPGAWTSGRKTSSVAITDGSITTSGTVACWAAADATNTRLHAAGDLSGGGAVTAGQAFSLASFDVQMARAAVSGDSAAATAFISRATTAFPTLDTTHQNAYKALLNSLTTAGLFNSDGTSNFLEGLYCWRNQSGGNAIALLDMTAAQNDLTNTGGALTYNADTSISSNLSAGINAGTKTVGGGTPFALFSKNSAHQGIYSLSSGSTTISQITAMTGFYDNANSCFSFLQRRCSDATPANAMRWGMNSSAIRLTTALASQVGYFVGNRSNSTSVQLYQDASVLDSSSSDTSSAGYGVITSFRMGLLYATTDGGNTNADWNFEHAFAHFGASLTSTQVSALKSAFDTYIATIHP